MNIQSFHISEECYCYLGTIIYSTALPSSINSVLSYAFEKLFTVWHYCDVALSSEPFYSPCVTGLIFLQ